MKKRWMIIYITNFPNQLTNNLRGGCPCISLLYDFRDYLYYENIRYGIV